MKRKLLAAVLGGAVLLTPVVSALVGPGRLAPSNNIVPARIATVARQHRNFSVEQRVAVLREIQTELHPLWRNLSLPAKVRRVAMWLAHSLQQNAAAVSLPAAFVGNQTVVTNTSGGVVGLMRQADCSLSLYNGTYTLGTSAGIQLAAPVPNYELTLHTLSGLATQAGVFAKGCADPTLGIGSRRGAYLGKTTQGFAFMAGSGYDNAHSANALFSGAIDLNSTALQSGYASDLSFPGIDAIAPGDLNGDGLADVVGRDVGSASIRVWLANSNGTLGTPASYALTGAPAGTVTEAVVLADVSGDGKVDVVVASCSQFGCNSISGQEQIWIFTGKGDGTLNTPQHFVIATPGSFPISNLIAADLRGTGHMDLVGSNGVVLLNNGSGSFAAGSSAFVPEYATSAFGPNLAAGDFNNDGKIDLAVNNGATIQLSMGNGDGTFTAGKAYASINNVGYLTATDLDGDGNVDLYVGLANGGAFGSDQFEVDQAYAMMGNGDGSFQGAPAEPFTYTGTNGGDLNGDGKWDFVGVGTGTLTTYLGDGSGGFAAHATLAISPVTINGQSVAVAGDINSYAVGDINGDGHPDLAYIVSGFTVQNAATLVFTPGVFISLGDGQGGLAAPSFYPVPTTLASPDFDIAWTISNLHLADFNGDHKVDLIYSYVTSSYTVSVIHIGTVAQLGNGNGTFGAPQVIPFYASPTATSRTSNVSQITDLNKDGIPDLIFVTQSPTIDTTLSTYVANIQVALGAGNGTFSTPATVTGPAILVAPLTGTTASVAVGDMNNDGIADIVALGSSTIHDVELAVALGNGNGTFKAPVLTDYGAQYLNTQQGIALGDFNGDGKLDVAVSDPFIATDAGVSLGNGDGTVQTIAGGPGTLPGQSIGLLVSGSGVSQDFNGDGMADALMGSTMLLSQGVASGGFTTTTTLTVTPSAATVGESVTLAARVLFRSGGTPTGTVTFLDGAAILGTDSLTPSAFATFTTTALTAGTHSLTARYSGDGHYAGSTSSATSLTVGAALDFSLSASPTSGSVAPGGSATTTLTLAPSGGSSGTVTLACSGLPAGAACTFSPSSVALNGAPGTSTLMISTASTMAQSIIAPPGRSRDPFLPAGPILAGIFTPCIARRQRRRASVAGKALAWMGVLVVCAGAIGLPGCGGSSGGGNSGGGTPSGTYNVTVTATSGSVSHTTTYALTVT